jgi:hypothetical protein
VRARAARGVREADGGIGWVVTLNGVGSGMTGLFRARAQDEVFGADPESRACGSIALVGTGVKLDSAGGCPGRGPTISGEPASANVAARHALLLPGLSNEVYGEAFLEMKNDVTVGLWLEPLATRGSKAGRGNPVLSAQGRRHIARSWRLGSSPRRLNPRVPDVGCWRRPTSCIAHQPVSAAGGREVDLGSGGRPCYSARGSDLRIGAAVVVSCC